MRYEAFYHTPRWRKKRAAILRRDGYCCQISKKYGRIVEANTVHHIFPRKLYPQYEWCDWNLISVCASEHERLEDRTNGRLTDAGFALMCEVAKERGIEVKVKVLVIGLPGTGKTTYVRGRLGADGLCYDLDALAAAFRLKQPGEERHGAARKMANDLLLGFAENADIYTPRVFVIRTAPTLTEIEALEPDEIVVLEEVHEDRHLPKESVEEIRERIEHIKEYAAAKAIPLTVQP